MSSPTSTGTPYPFADSAFDCLTAIHVIEHVDDVIRTMEEFHRRAQQQMTEPSRGQNHRLIVNLEAGKTVEGGSTITQQLVRNLCISNPARSLERKIIEAQLAIEYAERHSRREILGEYLNTASYGTLEGATAVGVQAASKISNSAAGLEADPGAGRAAGRAAAGAVRRQPGPQPPRGKSPPQHRARGDGPPWLRLAAASAAGASGRP